MRRIRRLLAVAALAALVLPAGASAHATLLSTNPADGAALERAPRSVRVRFDDTIRPGHGIAAVDNASGASVLAGAAAARGRVLTIPLRDHLGKGSYSVRWSVVSEDGHREQGVLAFSVGTGVAPQSVLRANTPLGWWAVGFRIAFYLGLLVAAGATVFGLGARRRELDRPLAQLLFFALLLAFLGASGVDDAAPSGTRNALVLEIALAVSLAGAAAAALVPRVPRLLGLAGGCALALLAAPALSGHALDRNQPHWLSVPADLAHTAAAAAWLGGLASLLVLVPRLPQVERGAAIRQVSRTALIAVPVLAVAGVLRAVTELGSVHQLWTTGYGRALVIKTALFVPVVALGWLNRSRLIDLWRILRQSVRVELAVLALVVGVVAVLVQLRPGRDAPRAAVRAAVAVPQPPMLPPRDGVVDAAEDGALAVGVARTPGATFVTLLGPDGTGVDGRAVTVDGEGATRCGPGCYRAASRPGPVRVGIDGRALTFAVPASARDASVLLRRATRAYRGATSIVFDETLRSGPTGGVRTRFTLKAPDQLAYRIRGGAQAVVLGKQRWDRASPKAAWQLSQQTPLQVTQPYWRTASNVHLVAPRTLTFLDRSLPAWFRLTLDDRGRPLRLHMTAAAHFMSDRYVAYDVPVTLSPPSR